MVQIVALNPMLPRNSPGTSEFAQVQLLAMNQNLANNSQSAVDQSTAARTLTVVGTTKAVTAQFPTGMTSSWLFGVSAGDCITAANSAAFQFGTGEWSIEVALRFSTGSGTQVVYCNGYNGVAGQRSLLIYFDTNSLHVAQSSNGVLNSDVSRAWTPSINTWYWLQVVCNGSVVKISIDGTQVGADIAATGLFASNQGINIGSDTQGDDFTGWMGPMRIWKPTYRPLGAVPVLPLPTS